MLQGPLHIGRHDSMDGISSVKLREEIRDKRDMILVLKKAYEVHSRLARDSGTMEVLIRSTRGKMTIAMAGVTTVWGDPRGRRR